MNRALLALAALTAAFAFAQPRAATSLAADAGIARDAGSVAPGKRGAATEPDRQAPEAKEPHSRNADLIIDLQLRVTALERSRHDAEARADKLEKALEEMRDDVAKVKEAETRRQDAERAVATRKAQTATANGALGQALQQLSTGSTDVEGALRTAEASYSGDALKLVELARTAMRNGDLNSARQLLTLAIIEANAAR